MKAVNQAIFLEVVRKFLTIWRDTHATDTDKDLRGQFSRVKVMKLFFFFCILDDKQLMLQPEHFDTFLAYPFGPVHEESYKFLKSEEGDTLFKALCRGEKSAIEFPQGSDDVRNRIDEMFEEGSEILNKLKKLVKMPVDELVELSHIADSWRNAFLYSSNHKMDIMQTLTEDKAKIDTFLSNWQVA